MAMGLCGALVVGARADERPPDPDLLNLQEGIPMRVQDAYVLPELAVEADLSVNWGYGRYYDAWSEARTQVAWGIRGGVQGVAGMRFVWNSFDRTGHEDIYLQGLKQLHQGPRDALLGGVKLNFPAGRDYARVDTSFPGFAFTIDERRDNIDLWLTGVYTRVLDPVKGERLHAEVQYEFVNSAPQGFDSRRWFLALGYDRRVARDTLAMASVWWETSPNWMTQDSTVLQLGLRRRQRPGLVWGLSLDLGLGWEWASHGLSAGAQYGF